MSETRAIIESIQKVAGTQKQDTVSLFWASVKSVDEANATCTVIINIDTELPDVALQASVSDGLLLVPAVDSDVVVARSKKGASDFIILTSDLDKVLAQVGGASITMWSSAQNGGQSIQFNDGTFGGLLKLIDPNNNDGGVLARLNKIENDINNLKQLLTTVLSAPVNEPGNGAPSQFQGAMKGALASWYSQSLQVTQRTDIENKTITHGKLQQ